MNLETVFLKEFLVVFLWLHSSTISKNAVFAQENVFFYRRVAQRKSTRSFETQFQNSELESVFLMEFSSACVFSRVSKDAVFAI